ncbi:nucleolar RNA-binding Nop10p family protein [Candidatus Woesearchaeota archaeon]|nr:nucleolar RNA-binding Nop10p family protein [Candidatus Woesearchaeota archaeon]
MAEHIHKCTSCRTYTMNQECPSGHGKTIFPQPAKFSIPDKYGKYRREARKEELKNRGLY